MFRGTLNSVPLTVLIIVAVAFTFAVVVLAVWLIRRWVPATSEGFHAEISAPMLGVVAALFGLILAFVIVFHVVGPAAIAIVVAISLVVLLDLTYPFSGDVAITPDDFKTGALAPFFHLR